MLPRMTPEEAALLPIQHLAWMGDAVYDLYCRQKLIISGATPGQKAHQACSSLTSAWGQAEASERLLASLTEKEQELWRRGRNAKGLPRSSPEYCQATGLEVVMGWLWLSHQHQRLADLFAIILGSEDIEGSSLDINT